MKKVRTILSLVPLVFTAAVLPFFPDRVPMHYGFDGQVDRFGSRYELFLLPLIIILVTVVSALYMKSSEAKANGPDDDSEAASARANLRVLGITSLLIPAIFGALQLCLLWMTYRNAGAENVNVNSDIIMRAAFILVGVMMLVMGNYMPKTVKNNFFGFRMSWTMYNENTWRKSNRFGGIVMMIVGLLMIISSAVVPPIVLPFVMLGMLTAAIVVMTVYAYRVYRAEKTKDSE